MKELGLVLVGVGLGFAVAQVLLQPSDCNAYVAQAVRAKVGNTLGTTAQGIGDAFGLWPFLSGAVVQFGVQP